MNIILKEDIPTLGKLGDIVDVSDGYARNYLLPKGVAVKSTAKNLKMLENEKKGIEKKLSKIKEDAAKLCAELETLVCVFNRKTGEDNKLFGSVTSIDIEGCLNEKGFVIDRRKILLDEPIRIIGEHTVPVKLHKDITANIKIVVEKE